VRPLALTVARAGGRGRAVLVTATTAVVSGLLLVLASMARLDWDTNMWTGAVIAPIADPGTRPGAMLGVVLLVVPLLLLLDQAVRLGSTARQRRYAALTVAGATSSDVRRWAALEVGGPAAVGAVLGIPTWLVLRYLLTDLPNAHQRAGLVPDVGPGAWTLLVVAAVTAYGVLVGRRAGSRLSDIVAGSRGLRPPPRPWPALLLVASVLLIVTYGGTYGRSDVIDLLSPLAAVLCAVGGIAGLAPWAGYRAARALTGRVRTGAGLLAAARLSADPRPAGRAAAAVGAVAITGGVLGAFVPEARRSSGSGWVDDYGIPAAIVAACAVAVVLVVAASLAIHSTETLLERRREMAALVATGVPPVVVAKAQRLECLIATIPLTISGALVGGVGYALLTSFDAVTLSFVALATVVTTAIVLLAVWATTRLLRPWVLDAVDPDQLRTA
jgi:hypothetical protein